MYEETYGETIYGRSESRKELEFDEVEKNGCCYKRGYEVKQEYS